MSKFVERWDNTTKVSLSEKIRTSLRSPEPLRPKLERAIRGLQLQIQRLDNLHNRLTERDKQIFSKVVEAYSKHDMARATIYANELAEIRKMAKMVLKARLALEQVVIRLSTIHELGEAVTVIAPAMGVIRNVRNGLSVLLPEAERELGEISSLLSGLLVEAGQTAGLTINFDVANEDAQKILEEAAKVAEERMKQRFPELPSSLPSNAGSI